MNDLLFERLLHEEESTALDFKKQQYPFVKATDEEKSELLKDILGFANAWRRSEAYILIGVEDVRGGRGNVVGITANDHLDDHALQQFVNNLTNRPVRFHYEAFGFEDKQVGIIRIEEQTRPLYLKRDYGKLKKDQVFVRRGSSTDPTKPATVDEIAQMGHGLGPQSAQMSVEFADLKRDDSLGQHISCETELCEVPPRDSIPDLIQMRQRDVGLGIDLPVLDNFMHRINKNYLREMANYEKMRRPFSPVRLVMKNVGQVAGNDVRLELTISAKIGVVVLGLEDLPDPPKRRTNQLDVPALRDIESTLSRSPGDVTIDKNDERFRIEIDCGDLQPGRRVWSGVFYVGKGSSGDLLMNGQVFAENLPQPKDFRLVISFDVKRTVLSLEELKRLPEAVKPKD